MSQSALVRISLPACFSFPRRAWEQAHRTLVPQNTGLKSHLHVVLWIPSSLCYKRSEIIKSSVFIPYKKPTTNLLRLIYNDILVKIKTP